MIEQTCYFELFLFGYKTVDKAVHEESAENHTQRKRNYEKNVIWMEIKNNNYLDPS